MTTPLRAIHLALVLVMAWLAVILAVPVPTFPTGLAYAEMAALAPEWVWACGFAAAAAFGAFGLRPCRTGPIRWHWLCLAVLSIAHSAVAVLVGMANPVSTGTGVYAIYAGLGLFLLREHIRHD